LRELTGGPDITFYWARHSFASLACNSCRMSKDDVALALNHVDEVQEKVVGLLRELDHKIEELNPKLEN